jgi:hypothetical protein
MVIAGYRRFFLAIYLISGYNVGREDLNPSRFSGACIPQYIRKSLDNTQSIVCVIFFALKNAGC